jgi:hypothetical protein
MRRRPDAAEGWGDDGKLRASLQEALRPSPALRHVGDCHSDGGLLSTAATVAGGGGSTAGGSTAGSILSTPHNEPEDDENRRGARGALSRSGTPELVVEERSFESVSLDSPVLQPAQREDAQREAPVHLQQSSSREFCAAPLEAARVPLGSRDSGCLEPAGAAVRSKRRKNLRSSRAEQPPRVAGITHERWFAVPRYDGLDPVPDLAQSQGDFFRSVFDPPLKQDGIRDVGDVRPRQRPFSALGFVPARPSEQRNGQEKKQRNGQENVAKSREFFNRLAIDPEAAHPASFAEFFLSSGPSAWHKRAAAAPIAAPASTKSERHDSAAASRKSRSDACKSPQRFTRNLFFHSPAAYSSGARHGKHRSQFPTPQNAGSCQRVEVGGAARGAWRAGSDGRVFQECVECEDADVQHFVMNPVSPSVQITISNINRAKDQSRDASERAQQRPRSRCKSAVGTRTVHASPARHTTQPFNLSTSPWPSVAENDLHAPQRVGQMIGSPLNRSPLTRPCNNGQNSKVGSTVGRHMAAGDPDKFPVTVRGPGPAGYVLKPAQIANPSLHPPARSARIGNTKRGSYIEDSIHNNKSVPPVGTYETLSQDAGSSGRMMRVSKMRRSPSACFPRDERVCCTCAAVGPRDQNVAYDDVRITAYRSWMG